MDIGAISRTLFDLLLVVMGFSFIVVVHEAGHFLAARWAGIRVLAFALGFGPAIVTYRKGLGVRRGSSEQEYLAMLRQAGGRASALPGVSATEYRWNLMPLGGYVKMLGQDDADPTARSDEPDSYQRCVPWKRMIVISAGVIMNVILAAALFVVVFSAGLRTEPPRIGDVLPGSPAATARADNGPALGVTDPGLKPQDLVLSIDGEKAESFKDLAIAAAMSARGSKLLLEVQRPGVSGVLRFSVEPRPDRYSKMMSIGVAPAVSPELVRTDRDRKAEADLVNALAAAGVPGARPGMSLVSVNGKPAAGGVYDLSRAARQSNGAPIEVEFADAAGAARGVIHPRVEFGVTMVETGAGRTDLAAVESLLGLTPVMMIDGIPDPDKLSDKRLMTGDVFALLGDLEWPNTVEGRAEIARDERASIRVVVLRKDAAGESQLVDLGDVTVTKGKLGVLVASTALSDTLVARFPRLPIVPEGDPAKADTTPPSGARLALAPGSRIIKIDGAPVADFGQIRDVLKATVAAGRRSVTLTVREPLLGVKPQPLSNYTWVVSDAEATALADLRWTSPIGPWFFESEKTLLRAVTASGGVDVGGALLMGLHETRNVMVQTYLTFARLFQGTVKVEQLKGPVGIAHVGTLIAERGLVWLLFFMAVVSVNLAVINFLPLPIVDGGHFLFLIWEQATGKPVSAGIQNAATIAGLLLIGSVFLFVTYNDLVNLFKL